MHTRDLLAGAGLGAFAMYMFDPDRGTRRRALARDKMTFATHKTRDGVDAAVRDLTNRSRGVAATTRGRFTRAMPDDTTLVERVRAKLGRACSHPHAVDVFASNGEVTLTGPILAGEVDDVLATVAAVRGVTGVVNSLEVYQSSDGIPSLQGEGRRAGPAIDLLQRNWAPATRVLVGAGVAAAGLAAAGYARRRSHDGYDVFVKV
jgi:hypothetical protein